MFITFEGIDGSGKTTQLRRVAARLDNPLTTKEPGGTPTADRIRAVLLDQTSKLDPLAEVLLFAASRHQHVAEVIRPALAERALHAREDLVLAAVRVDDHEARRLRHGQREVALAHAAVEAQVFRLEAQLVAAAPARAAHAGLLVDVEEQGEVGRERAGGPVVQRAQPVEIEQSSEALKGERGIGVAVAQDDAPRLERGADHLDHVLMPRRRE